MTQKYPNITPGTIEAVINKLGGKKGVKAFLSSSVKIISRQLIDMLGTTTISATTEKFVAKEKFHKDSKEVKFYEIWDSFINEFLSGDGKIEVLLGEQELCYGNLIKNSCDGLIIEELGGESNSETFLSGVYEMLKKQASGEEGELLTNGCANIFYIKNTSDTLCAVFVGWISERGWIVGARTIEHPSGCLIGDRVFGLDYLNLRAFGPQFF